MSERVKVEVELQPAMQAFLEEMAKKYNLPDAGKVMRCLINYARAETDKQDDIFQKIRCPDC